MTELSDLSISGEHNIIPSIPALNFNYKNTKPVKIGNRVWIVQVAIVLKGVIVGDDSIIGAHSVITKNVEIKTIAVGNPAKVIQRNMRWIL